MGHRELYMYTIMLIKDQLVICGLTLTVGYCRPEEKRCYLNELPV